MAAKQRYVVVGGGLAGLAAIIKLAEAGEDVDVFSFVPCRRSHSVCAQGGINGAVNTKGEGDSTWEHFDDSVYGGDFLANQPPVKAMCEAVWGGRVDEARAIHYRTMDVVDALFVEPNPTPVKQALEWLGLPAGPLRPPLERLSPGGQQVLRAALQAGGWLA